MALEFGMTSKEFWQDDPNLFSSYRTFYINKYKKQSEIDNNNAWLFGLYNNMALNVSLSNMWKKEGEKPSMYFEKPIDFSKPISKSKKEMDIKDKLKANLEHFAKRSSFIPKK